MSCRLKQHTYAFAAVGVHADMIAKQQVLNIELHLGEQYAEELLMQVARFHSQLQNLQAGKLISIWQSKAKCTIGLISAVGLADLSQCIISPQLCSDPTFDSISSGVRQGSGYLFSR